MFHFYGKIKLDSHVGISYNEIDLLLETHQPETRQQIKPKETVSKLKNRVLV